MTQVQVVDNALRMADLVAAALTKDGYAADFTPASLREIDRFFDEQTRKGEPRRWGLLAKDTSLRLFSIGAYVGEVVRREVGGEWEGDDEDEQAELNLALRLPDDSVVWPVQRTIERMRNGAEDGIAAYAVALGVDVGEKPGRGRKSRKS
jgi:hypothetical protein